MPAKKILYLDIETTGLNPENGHVILSIGAVADRKVKKNPVVEFYGLICPTPQQFSRASQEALQVNGATWDVLREQGRPFADVRDDFLRFLVDNGLLAGKTMLVGQNPEFDLEFLDCYMGGELRFVGFPFEDVYDNRDFYSILVNRRQMPLIRRRSGDAISEALGLEPEPKPHNALTGARTARRNYEAMLALGVREG
jgi:DNA polymerase III epsilon subunit-like protein